MKHHLKQHIEEIIKLTDEEFEFILSHFETTNKRKRQYLLQEGEIADKEYWIVKGCLKATFLMKMEKNIFYSSEWKIGG
ncbi:hypothetical protein [Gaetbulibacter sp. S0825]|uniref:hypothetical protein n=1 Tax=Gaetbulibacter sp. S0825 TaxID=2720084 RepID=UPI003298405F